jgi:hypothetical protein
MNKRVLASCLFGVALAVTIVGNSSAGESVAGPSQVKARRHTPAVPAPNVGQAMPMGEQACSSGYYTCPDDGEQFFYANLPQCIGVCGADGTKVEMHTACENYCSATCTATQWFFC